MMIITRLLPFLILFLMAGCASEPAPPAPPAREAAPADKKTSVKVGPDGVVIESGKGDLQVSPDSARIELR